MNTKIKILFVSQHVVNQAIFQAGHKSFCYYLSNFCEDGAFEAAYIVNYCDDDDEYEKMKREFSNAHDFSIGTPIYIKILRKLYRATFFRAALYAIKPIWIYMDPFRSFLFKKGLRKAARQGWIPDVIVFEWTEVIFLSAFCRKLFSGVKLVATEHDVTFKKMFRQFDKRNFYRNFLLKRLKKKELEVLKTLDLVSVLSSDDLLLLERNCVDIEKTLLITPFYNKVNEKQDAIRPNIVFYGAMNRLENLTAATWFLSKVFIPYQLNNFFSLIVMGSGIPEEFKIKHKDVENLIVTGFVEKPEEVFKSALCMVVPLIYGGGIKVKVLEAMSSSVAVLSNGVGIEGINAVPDISYIHCSEPLDYYNAIVKLANDYQLARSIGEAGRVVVDSHFDFEKSYHEYRSRVIDLVLYKKAGLTVSKVSREILAVTG